MKTMAELTKPPINPPQIRTRINGLTKATGIPDGYPSNRLAATELQNCVLTHFASSECFATSRLSNRVVAIVVRTSVDAVHVDAHSDGS